MGSGVFAFDAISRPGRREWVAIAIVAVLTLLFLPLVVWKTVWLGQGDVQVFFRAGWAIWTGYPLYEVTDHHGWTYHYPPTFALFMGPFANPLPDHSRPWWALPFPRRWRSGTSSMPLACCSPFMSGPTRWSAIGPSTVRAGIFAASVGAAALSADCAPAFHRRRIGPRPAGAGAAFSGRPVPGPLRREPRRCGIVRFFARHHRQIVSARAGGHSVLAARLEIHGVDGGLVHPSFALPAAGLPRGHGDVRTLPHHVHRSPGRHRQRSDVDQDRERGFAGRHIRASVSAPSSLASPPANHSIRRRCRNGRLRSSSCSTPRSSSPSPCSAVAAFGACAARNPPPAIRCSLPARFCLRRYR